MIFLNDGANSPSLDLMFYMKKTLRGYFTSGQNINGRIGFAFHTSRKSIIVNQVLLTV